MRKGEYGEKIENMTLSIKNFGLLYPVRLRRVGKRFTPTDGFGRVMSAKRLGWPTVPSIIEGDECSDVNAQLTALIANCQRSNYSDLDTAAAVAHLMQESGWNASETAAKLGFSNAKVSRLRELLTLPEPIRDAIRAGRIPASSGADLSRIEDPHEQAALAERVASGEVTRDGLAGMVKRRRVGRMEKTSTTASRVR